MPFTPIVATLGYVMSPDRRRVLLIHRTGRPGDHHAGKFNGLGGKMEPGEDVVACMRREIREEAGDRGDGLPLSGPISFARFWKKRGKWVGFLFRLPRPGGPIQAPNRQSA